MKKGLLPTLGLAGLVLVIDQCTKFRAEMVWQPTPWFPWSWFGFTYSENHGIAFGIPFGGMALLFVTGAFILGLSWFAFKSLPLHKKSHQLVLGMILGGALGNWGDRVLNGAVRDFIQIGIWPTFNVADMAIVSGILGLLWILRGKH